MTRPLTNVRQRIIVAMMKAKMPFTSQRDIAVAAGLVAEPVERNSAKLRLAQRAVVRLVKQGVISRQINNAKVDNVYRLSPAGRAIGAISHADAISPKPRTAQPAAQAPR